MKNQTFSWPVKTYGNLKEKQERLKEHELYAEYCKIWGIISPPHYHTLQGSGWWRVRYKMALDAGCIIYGHPSETSILGFVHDLKNIENCRSDELVDIFNTQAEILKKKFWTKERTKEFFKCLLEE